MFQTGDRVIVTHGSDIGLVGIITGFKTNDINVIKVLVNISKYGIQQEIEKDPEYLQLAKDPDK